MDRFDTPFAASVATFSGSQSLVERRQYPRFPFRSYQWVAIRRGEAAPRLNDFEQFQCHDISLGGISFLAPDRLPSSALLIALVALPKIVYMDATIVHCTHVLAYPTGRVEPMPHAPWNRITRRTDDNLAAPMLLVGCRFTHRLQSLPVPAKRSKFTSP
ncbi:MAG: PilZ domain-containing protein [Patescibacteria group bacterium]|nr:PilZ domain-containing protein [Patescibacteria group bacterium]